MPATTPWQRLIDCEYQSRCDVALRDRFDWYHKICQGAVVLSSTSAVLMWLGSIAAWSPSLASAVAAAFAVADLIGRFAERAALHNASAVEWGRLRFAFEAVHFREDGGEEIGDYERNSLDEQFRTLDTKDLHQLRPKFHTRIMDEVLRSLGYPEDEITSRAWLEA